MNKREGISPLIATVLLIAFTIAVGGIISVWLTQFARTQTDQNSENAAKASTCAEDTFFFSKSDINASGQFLNIIITNEGKSNQTDFDVYLTHKNTTFAANATPNGGSAANSVWPVNATNPLQPTQRALINMTFLNGGLTIGDKSNVSKVVVTLGSSDQCAGKSYTVTF